MPRIELISFKLCPFVQRSVITLLEKDIPFEITYIDLHNKPDWFLEISPLGKVPVLRIDGEKILFESAVINEYLDEITPPSLHPSDPFEKAQNRAWVEFGSALLMTSYRFKTATDQETLAAEKNQLIEQLQRLETQVNGKVFFNGTTFSLADAAFAPILRWIEMLDRRYDTGLLQQTTGLQEWAKTLLSRPSVKNSVVQDFEDRVHEQMLNGGSALATQGACRT
ncbi:MAG: glutathione S-transferase family protein [Endozoicomonas sp.]